MAIKLNQALIKESLDKAVSLYHANNFDDARLIYETILLEDPNNCDALHLLGLVNFSLKNHQQALILITKAISNFYLEKKIISTIY